jgi:putative tryptophan/tyrosine transport system substrate-binding protein
MRRRQFIKGILGVAAAWPSKLHAQQTQLPVIGFVNSSSAQTQVLAATAYRRGLEEVGFAEGRNVLIESRWADGNSERLPELISELLKRKVAIIMAGGPPAAHAAKKATSTVPIVFTTSDDPVKAGLVTSINRPGANLTGVHIFFSELETKKLSLIKDLLPQVSTVAALVDPKFTATNPSAELNKAAQRIGLQIHIINASDEKELAEAFASMTDLKIGALVVATSTFFNTKREQIVSLAAQNRIPAIYEHGLFAVAGGLMSYGTNIPDAYRQAGVYTGRILKGEKIADLPVFLATKFEFVINSKAAKTLGLTIPHNLLDIADTVIE